jgi:hypothetical protein
MRKVLFKLGIVSLLSLSLIYLFKSKKKYDIEIWDENGYIVECWNEIKKYEIINDTTLSMENGNIVYNLKPGEEIKVRDYPY